MPFPRRVRPPTVEAFLRKVSSQVIAIAAENVTIPAGAAGAVVNFRLTTSPIANSMGNDIAVSGDTSLVLTSTAFTSEVQPTDDSSLTNGQYYVDYLTGNARGKKADNSVAATANYNVFSAMVNATLIADNVTVSENLGKVNGHTVNEPASGVQGVALTDGTNPIPTSTSSADGESNTANRLPTEAHIKAFNGVTWDKIRSGQTVPTATLVGFLNDLVWAIYNASPTTRTEGQGGPLQANSAGSLLVDQQTKGGGEDLVFDVMKVQEQASYLAPLTASGVARTGAGQLMGWVVNSCGAGATVKVWDNTAGSGTVLFDTITFTAAVNQGPSVCVLPCAVKLTAGAYFTLSGTISLTPLFN